MNKTQNAAGDATVSAHKKPKSKKPVLFLFGVIVVVGFLVALTQKSTLPAANGVCDESNMYISKYRVQLAKSTPKTYNLEFATTPSQQELGLSGRPCMPQNSALVFLFPTDDTFGIWMKQMKFDIDVIWLNKDKKIVSIEKGMQPSSYPKVYYPASDTRYVIELLSGEAQKMGVSVGQELYW